MSDAPICTTEAARAAGLDIAPSPSELTAMAETIVASRGGGPTPEVDLARAVALACAEIGRLRAELAGRPSRGQVRGHCPACRGESLFLGSGGYVTCSRIECPEPDAASATLEHRADQQRQHATEGGVRS